MSSPSPRAHDGRSTAPLPNDCGIEEVCCACGRIRRAATKNSVRNYCCTLIAWIIGEGRFENPRYYRTLLLATVKFSRPERRQAPR